MCMGKVLEPVGVDVAVASGHVNSDRYHTRECQRYVKIDNPRLIDRAVADDWKKANECHFCKRLKSEEEQVVFSVF